jgi:CSLREA domain-containing protein
MTQASEFLVRMKRVAGSGRILIFGLLLAAALVAASLLLTARPAHANTFIVNTTSDSGDGACTLSECTLREAIDAANDRTGADTINFNILGSGVHTIAPSTGLPGITDPVVIDGYSQPGTKPNTLITGNDAILKIELSGASAELRGQSGLWISSANSTIKGLAIHSWENSGIGISRPTSTANKVQGNFIGTDVSGTKDLGNYSGVSIWEASNNTIGGTAAGTRNLISANDSDGVHIQGLSDYPTTGNKIEGNYIGTDKNGTADLGNTNAGVVIYNEHRHTTGNSILSNSFHGNRGGLGIDLTQAWPPDGVTANDEDDPDAGPNNLQNFPDLDSAIASGRRITIKGTLNSLPNRRGRGSL